MVAYILCQAQTEALLRLRIYVEKATGFHEPPASIRRFLLEVIADFFQGLCYRPIIAYFGGISVVSRITDE